MQVNLQYAEEHFADLASAVDAGEEVEISRPNLPALKLVASNGKFPEAKQDRSDSFGAGKGKIWMSDDRDSPEVNEEIAKLFNGSKL